VDDVEEKYEFAAVFDDGILTHGFDLLRWKSTAGTPSRFLK